MDVEFDAEKTNYDNMLSLFWRKSSCHMTAIFYHSAEQKKAAEESVKKMEAAGKGKKVLSFSGFDDATEYVLIKN